VQREKGDGCHGQHFTNAWTTNGPDYILTFMSASHFLGKL
jgi:hypothetical protein